MSRIFSYLACTVTALPCQVLPVNQGTGGSTALKWKPGINECGGAGVVIDEKGLEDNTFNQWSKEATLMS